MEEALRQCLLFAKSRNNTVKKENNLSIDEQLRKDILEFALSIACIDDKLDTQEIITIGNILGGMLFVGALFYSIHKDD